MGVSDYHSMDFSLGLAMCMCLCYTLCRVHALANGMPCPPLKQGRVFPPCACSSCMRPSPSRRPHAKAEAEVLLRALVVTDGRARGAALSGRPAGEVIGCPIRPARERTAAGAEPQPSEVGGRAGHGQEANSVG